MSELATRRFGFIGGGAMAEALAGGLIAAGVPADRVQVADPDPARQKALHEAHGLRVVADNVEAAAGCDAVVIAVKPGVVPTVLTELREAGADRTGPVWISIAAGVPIDAMAEALGDGARIVRAMPNTPSLVHTGATAIHANAAATAEDRAIARGFFEAVGTCWEAPNEALLDAVTGLSGSGPAYVFVFLEALGDAGVRMGLPRDAAYELAFQTVLGAARLAIDSGRHPAALKDQVTSPGGTTIAGLERLEAGGFRAAVHDAVEAATRRSRELGS